MANSLGQGVLGIQGFKEPRALLTFAKSAKGTERKRQREGVCKAENSSMEQPCLSFCLSHTHTRVRAPSSPPGPSLMHVARRCSEANLHLVPEERHRSPWGVA